MKILTLIAICTSLGIGHLAGQARTGGSRFSLSGTVIDGVGKQPLAGVEVSLQGEKWEEVGQPVTSDAQGRFAFGGLEAGEYILSATGSGFGTVRYGEAPDPGWVSTIHVGGETANKSVVFAVMARGSIEGVIRDEFGDPMLRANVSILRPLWRNGHTTLATVTQKSTDDRGVYRFGYLPPGNYVLCTGQNGVAAPIPGPVDFAARVENRFYTRTCYPAASNTTPRTFQLAPGQHAQVDLTPTTGTTATLRGRIHNAPQGMGFGIYLASDEENGGQSFGGSVDPSQGTFVIRGIPPGHYRLRSDVRYATNGGPEKQLTAEIPVDIGGSDVDGLDLTLDSGGTVDVTIHGLAENHVDPTTVSALLQRADSSRVLGSGPAKGDGSAHLEGIPPGRYRLRVATPTDACVESIKVGDREIRGAAFDITAGAPIHADATISKNCGAIQMRALRDGEGVPGAKTVLLLSGTAKDPGDLKEDFANDEGGYSFSGLSAGRYLLWAWPVAGKGAMTGPSSLASVGEQATVVEVKAGETVQVDVPVLREEGKSQ